MRLPGSFWRNVSLSVPCSTDERDNPLGIPLISETLEEVRFSSPCATSSLLTSPSTYLLRGKGLREQPGQAHPRVPLALSLGEERRKNSGCPSSLTPRAGGQGGSCFSLEVVFRRCWRHCVSSILPSFPQRHVKGKLTAGDGMMG